MTAKKKKEYKVKISLNKDPHSRAESLMIDGDGFCQRITSVKGSGQWNTVKVFECKITVADLRKFEIKS